MQIMSIDFPLDTDHLPNLFSNMKIPPVGPTALFLQKLAAKKQLSFNTLRNLAILMSELENPSKCSLIDSEDKKQCISNISDVIQVAIDIIPSNLEILDLPIVTYVGNLKLGAEEYLRKLRIMPLGTIKEGLHRMNINSIEIRSNLYLEKKAIGPDDRDYCSPGKRKDNESKGVGKEAIESIKEGEEGGEVRIHDEKVRSKCGELIFSEEEKKGIEKKINSKVESQEELDNEVTPLKFQSFSLEPEDKIADHSNKSHDQIEEKILISYNDKIPDCDISSSLFQNDSFLKDSILDPLNHSSESRIKPEEKATLDIIDSIDRPHLKKSISLKKESKMQLPQSKTESLLDKPKESKLVTEKVSKIGMKNEVSHSIENKESEDRRGSEGKAVTSPIYTPTKKGLKMPTAFEHEIKSPPAAEESKLTRASTLKFQIIKEVPFNNVREPVRRSGTFEKKETGKSCADKTHDETASKPDTIEESHKTQVKKESRITKIKH